MTLAVKKHVDDCCLANLHVPKFDIAPFWTCIQLEPMLLPPMNVMAPLMHVAIEPDW